NNPTTTALTLTLSSTGLGLFTASGFLNSAPGIPPAQSLLTGNADASGVAVFSLYNDTPQWVTVSASAAIPGSPAFNSSANVQFTSNPPTASPSSTRSPTVSPTPTVSPVVTATPSMTAT